MIHINYKENLTYENKLLQMQQDAGFDVADAELTNTAGQAEEVSIPDPSIFQDIRSRQALPKVPKVFLSNQCSFNCAYCGCRAGREVPAFRKCEVFQGQTPYIPETASPARGRHTG